MADNRIAYGMLKQAGVDTEGMSPTEAWKKLNEFKDVAAKKGYAVAHKVDFTANNVVSLNAYVDTLRKLFKQYNIGKIKSILTSDVIFDHLDDGKKEVIKNRFDMLKNTSLLKKISYYASTNHQDFFAEIFVLKNMNKEPIPKPISDIFSELGV